MKFNIAYPLTGAQKTIDIDDDKRCAIFFDRRMGQEVEVENQLGDEFKGYAFKIMGGNDKQGFAMKQGVLVNGRTRLLLSAGSSTYRPRRTGERKRKTVRGCIVGKDIRALFLSITKVGEPIAGLTDVSTPRRLGPKRATKIRRLFALKKKKEELQSDVVTPLIKKSAIRRTFTGKDGKNRQKAPKIQRLITEDRLRRKRIVKQSKKEGWLRTRKAVEEYQKFISEHRKKKAAKAAEVQKAEQAKKTATTTATTTKQTGKAATTTNQKAPQGKQQQPATNQKQAQQPAQKQAATKKVQKK